MVKILFLQSARGIVDESIEIELHNRLDFMNFLDFHANIPNNDDNKDKTKKKIRKINKKRSKKRKEKTIIERLYSKTRRSKDGTFSKDNGKTHFGYKYHSMQLSNNDLMLNYCVTTVSVHDSNIDLPIP